MYDGPGSGERLEESQFRGISPVSVDDAIRAAVDCSDVPDGTTLVVTRIEVTTVGDPNVGDYIVILTPVSVTPPGS